MNTRWLLIISVLLNAGFAAFAVVAYRHGMGSTMARVRALGLRNGIGSKFFRQFNGSHPLSITKREPDPIV